jgi:hypothetical protein
MGSNRTQAQGVALFIIGFTLIAAGFSIAGSIPLAVAGLVAIGISIALFQKCKPWEKKEE